MKKILITAAVAAASCFLYGENFFPNGSFNGDWKPAWNRLACENYDLTTPGWSLKKDKSGQFLQSDGSGRKLELHFEAPAKTSSLSFTLTGNKSAKPVTVTVESYSGLRPSLLIKKSCKLTGKKQNIKFKIPRSRLVRYYNMAPMKLSVTPPKGVRLQIDDISCDARFKPVLNKAERTVPVPDLVKNPGKLIESANFTVKHYGKKSAMVPFTVVLPFASGKFNNASNWIGVQVRSADGKLFPAQGRIISRWPGNSSVRALAVDTVAFLKPGVNRLAVIPGKSGAPLKGSKEIRICAEDIEGNIYRGSFAPSAVEFAGPVRRVVSGWLELKSPGRPAIPVQCRMGFFKGIPDVEIEVSLHNPYDNRPFTIKSAYATVDSGKKSGKVLRSLAVKRNKKVTAAPHFLQDNGVIIMPQMRERHPAELRVKNGAFSIALWPDSVKPLILSHNLVLTRRFIWSPDKNAVTRFGYEKTVAMAEPERYGETNFFLIPAGKIDRKNFPYAARKVDETFQVRYSKAGQIKAGQTGVFDYGDIPGEGWANLESFVDYAELMRAAAYGDHDLLSFALDRAVHYRDIDTFRGESLYHAGNHVGGGSSYCHSWPQGIIYHYLMTGDPRSRMVLDESANSHLAKPVTYKNIADARSLARYLLALTDLYGALNKPELKSRFYVQYKHAEKTNLTPDRADDTIFPWGSRLAPFQVWYGACAFMEMYLLTGDKTLLIPFRREMRASLNMEFYELDLLEHWPGLTPEKGFPIQLGYHSRHRGTLIYPLLMFQAKVDNKPELADLARLTAYADWCAGPPRGGDSLEFFRLCVLEKGLKESVLLSNAVKLITSASTDELLNGDFSKSAKWPVHWNLHGSRNMCYDSAVDKWPLTKEKDFKKLQQERKKFSRMVSPWRYYARLRGALDFDEYGKAAPSLMIKLTWEWGRLGKAAIVTGNHTRLTPGKWRYKVSFKHDKPLSHRNYAELYIFTPGEQRQVLAVSLQKSDHPVVADKRAEKPVIRNGRATIRNSKKAGWKDLVLTFDLPQEAVASAMFYLDVSPRSRESLIWLDDIRFEKISER